MSRKKKTPTEYSPEMVRLLLLLAKQPPVKTFENTEEAMEWLNSIEQQSQARTK